MFSYLKNPGELEKAILKKGMTKAEAAKLGGKYMNQEEMLNARAKENEKMRQRRNQIDLGENGIVQDLYGNVRK